MSSRRRTAQDDPRRLTVVFDLGGVLTAEYDPVSALAEYTGGDAAALADAYWGTGRDELDRGAESGPYYAGLAAAAGMENPSEDDLLDLADFDVKYWTRLHPDARALINDLARNRIRLGLLSNSPAVFGEAVRAKEWSEVFAFELISGEEDLAKPDRRIYELLLDVIAPFSGGVAVPGNVVFFDDKLENVEAARQTGIDAHLWPRNGGHRAAGEKPGWEIARDVLGSRGVPLD